jgi:hypothetical protein
VEALSFGEANGDLRFIYTITKKKAVVQCEGTIPGIPFMIHLRSKIKVENVALSTLH